MGLPIAGSCRRGSLRSTKAERAQVERPFLSKGDRLEGMLGRTPNAGNYEGSLSKGTRLEASGWLAESTSVGYEGPCRRGLD